MKENKKIGSLKPVIVAVSGYFDPLHVGHLEMFGRAKSLGDILVVIVNNDKQAKLKNRKLFMKEQDRVDLIDTIEFVDKVVLSVDEDDSVCETLNLLKPDIFAQGGDKKFGEVPETKICKKLGVKMIHGLGNKIRTFSYETGKIEEFEKGEDKMEEFE